MWHWRADWNQVYVAQAPEHPEGPWDYPGESQQLTSRGPAKMKRDKFAEHDVPPRYPLLYKQGALYEGGVEYRKDIGPVFLDHGFDHVYSEGTIKRRPGAVASGYRHRRRSAVHGGRPLEPQPTQSIDVVDEPAPSALERRQYAYASARADGRRPRYYARSACSGCN